MRVLVLHGVNLNMFGKRDAATYGTITLAQIDGRLKALGRELGAEVECFQTNGEKEMVERIHRAHEDGTAAVVINAGAWTHYSYAIRDALEIANVPLVEVHLSDITSREDWRRHSVFEGLVLGVVSGKGAEGYREALEMLKKEFQE
jgi:3-dehydroquinate dehydratase-2